MGLEIIIYIILVIFIVHMFFSTSVVDKKRFDTSHLNQDSYQRYAKFYGIVIPNDEDFITKIKQIYKLINSRENDIKKIAEKSNCTLEECVLKIKYLKNKRLLGDYYVDTNNFKLLPCSKEDQKLIDKYKAYIYGSHLQINDIANLIPNKGYKDISELRDEVFKELVYLDKKGLINGIKIDEVDRKIIYYTIEKRREHKGYESSNCPNCGAINDVEIDGKVRCGYCKTIVKGSEYEENI